MEYKGKEYTNEEFVALMEQKDNELSETQGKLKKFEEEKPEEKPAEKSEEKKEEKALNENEKPEEKPAEKPEEKKEEQTTQLSEKKEDPEVRKLNERIITLETVNHKKDVEIKLGEYEKKGIPPAMISVAKNLMESDLLGIQSYKLSEESGEKKISLTEAVSMMLDAMEGR